VPRVSSFYGIVIAMYYREHGIAHFHARYGEHEVSMAIDSLHVLGGFLPPHQLRLVRLWAHRHRRQLRENWERARREEALASIAPLH
jgi:spore cortex formation protein SpoVR/YcgB (stage V sporulation)